jgi:hypothetical protein
MKTERTPFLAMGAVMFAVSFGLALVAGSSTLVAWREEPI